MSCHAVSQGVPLNTPLSRVICLQHWFPNQRCICYRIVALVWHYILLVLLQFTCGNSVALFRPWMAVERFVSPLLASYSPPCKHLDYVVHFQTFQWLFLLYSRNNHWNVIYVEFTPLRDSIATNKLPAFILYKLFKTYTSVTVVGLGAPLSVLKSTI